MAKKIVGNSKENGQEFERKRRAKNGKRIVGNNSENDKEIGNWD
jgi:hypothetical protein